MGGTGAASRSRGPRPRRGRAARRGGRARLYATLLAAGRAAVVCALWVGRTRAGTAPQVLATFKLREVFGVSHPDQIVDFDLDVKVDPGACRMIGPAGGEVPYQVLAGGTRIAVRTNLPAGAEKTWRLVAGKPSADLAGGIEVKEDGSCYKITNGLTGVRVPRRSQDLAALPAPIQGILLRDGTWTGTGPNALAVNGTAKGMNVRFLERGPLVVAVRIEYTFDRPEYRYGSTVLAEAGVGSYTSTVRIQAGQPSILFEEETDMDLSYSVDLYEGLRPDIARYRGHHSSAQEFGYEADGGRYRPWHERPPMDAFRDLSYDRPLRSDAWSGADVIRRMAVWDPWVFDSGWYWMMYEKGAPPGANLLGIFAGGASRALGAGNSGAGFFAGPTGGGGRSAGITAGSFRRTASGQVYPRSRFAWGMFVGTKCEGLKHPHEVQPIARQMNLHGGVNLNKVHRLQLDFPDPIQGYGAMYMPRTAVQDLIEKLRRDTEGPHGNGFHAYLYSAESSARPLVDMWKDASGGKLKEAVRGIADEAQNILDALVNGDGIYEFRYHYWHGGLAMSRKAVWIDQVLASDLASVEDKARAKAAAVLFASILYDDDFVPLYEGHGLNLGTPNMPVQQVGYRHLYALLLSGHPVMRERAGEARRSAIEMLRAQVNEHGAHMGSSNYVGAAMGPTLSTLQQLKMAGVADAFRDELRLAKFADFYLNFLTPSEPRFGGARKLLAIGDGSTVSTELYGQLATGFADVQPELSRRLMWAWRASGRGHSGFHGTTLLKIDERLPDEDARLASASFPGYYSVLRSGWGTERETAVWFVNGEYYHDHYHDDLGEVVIYALGAPLSLDFGSFYSPRSHGGLVHSVVLPVSAVGEDWKAVPPPLEKGGRWGNARLEAFQPTKDGGTVRASFSRDGLTWSRAVSLTKGPDGLPVIEILDGFSGGDAGASRVSSLNLMAGGEVATPEGRKLPGQGWTLPAGTSRLGFTGQTWSAHPTKGIDWDIAVESPRPQEAFISRWRHDWHPEREQQEFKRANARGFEEDQYILRIRGAGPLRLVIAPRPKRVP